VIDVTHQVNAVARRVTDRTFEAGEARSVTIARTYDTTIEDLWEACTTADRIARWLTPVSGDLELGGHYQLEGNAGGEVTACDPPNSFAATWEFGDQVSWIEVRITPDGDGARLELEHIARIEDHWTEFGPGAVGIGWDLGFLGLFLYLGGNGESPDYAEMQAWTTSAEGLQFMRETGTAWGEADLASGTNPDDAKARADRTIAAYTTPPEEPAG
jgi:uncharacterized protein YndB with AHSA1/START domain